MISSRRFGELIPRPTFWQILTLITKMLALKPKFWPYRRKKNKSFDKKLTRNDFPYSLLVSLERCTSPVSVSMGQKRIKCLRNGKFSMAIHVEYHPRERIGFDLNLKSKTVTRSMSTDDLCNVVHNYCQCCSEPSVE